MIPPKRMIASVVAAFVIPHALFVVVNACLPPVVSEVPGDRDGLATPIGKSCAKLRHLGCPEGNPGARGETCFERVTREALLAPIPDVADASSPEDVRSRGSNSTVRFRCATSDGAVP